MGKFIYRIHGPVAQRWSTRLIHDRLLVRIQPGPLMDKKQIVNFKKHIWDFYRKEKRTFPWRETSNPYHILVSEVMLQQTQAERVVPYYQRFIQRFPDFKSLAKAPFSIIYPLWQGLGYNRRALALKRTAQVVIKGHRGVLPCTLEKLESFPGVGLYTAKAIMAFAFNIPVAVVETNIRRVFIHHFFQDKRGITDQDILPLADKFLDHKNPRKWNFALMDYGAHLKKTIPNPNRRHARYRVQSKFEGSVRQIRGRIIRYLAIGQISKAQLTRKIKGGSHNMEAILEVLEKEGLIKYSEKNKKFSLK